MALIATAFLYLNRVDPDCGTTFSWVTRAMGPWFGWIGGWAIMMTGVLIVGSLADVGVRFGLYGFGELLGSDALIEAGDNAWIRMPAAIAAGAADDLDLRGRHRRLGPAAERPDPAPGRCRCWSSPAVAIYRAVDGNSPLDELTPELSWLNPFGAGGAALSAGLLLGVFAYWGWESSVNLSEETRDGDKTPGRAAVLSTFILLVTYVSVAIAVVAFAGTQWLSDNAGEEEFVFYYLADGGPRQLELGAARSRCRPRPSRPRRPRSSRPPAPACRWPGGRRSRRRIGHIHPRHRTPDVSTWTVAAIAIAWYVGMYQVSENALFDSLTALALLIAFYYALTGIACAVYYRKHLTESAKNLRPDRHRSARSAPALLIWLLVLVGPRPCPTRTTPTAARPGSASARRW